MSLKEKECPPFVFNDASIVPQVVFYYNYIHGMNYWPRLGRQSATTFYFSCLPFMDEEQEAVSRTMEEHGPNIYAVGLLKLIADDPSLKALWRVYYEREDQP